jgi:hypothetical protein
MNIGGILHFVILIAVAVNKGYLYLLKMDE